MTNMGDTHNIGMAIKAPEKQCDDKKCPFHGRVNVKSEEYVGKVIKKDINKSATVEWERQHYVKKYERYERRRSSLRVHNPACIDAAVGAVVRIRRARPLSKTKNFVVVEVL